MNTIEDFLRIKDVLRVSQKNKAMDKLRWKQITAIVDEVLRTEGYIHQKQILAKHCGDDAELQKQVLDLLQSIKNSTDYWDSLFLSNRLFIVNLTAELS